MSRPAIIDTDPGIDDALAILFALGAPGIDVIGVTTVAGNIGLDDVTRNALRLLALAGRPDIPVIAGAAAPLMRPAPARGTAIHGGDGVGGVALPEPQAAAATGAVAWMADTLAKRPAGTVDLLALGPLTNVAMLVRDHPDAARRIGRLIAMGGALDEPGNVGNGAEFNIAADPEAAELVFRAGLPLTLIPLDVTRRVRAGSADVARLARGTPIARTSADLIGAYFHATTGGESRPLHDPCVMLCALDPALFGVERRGVAVNLAPGADAGRLEPGPLQIDVALRVNGGAALARLMAGLGAP